MKKYFIGAICGFGFFILIGATTQINNRFQNEQELYNEFTNLYNTIQTRQFQVYLSTPMALSLKERELVLVSTGTISIVTRIGNSTYSVTLERK